MSTFKIKVIPTVLSAAISALTSYGLYTYCFSRENAVLLAIVGFVMIFGALFGIMGFSYDKSKALSLVRVVASLFLIAAFISNIVFCLIDFATPSYILVNGVFFLAYILAVYMLDRAAV